VQVLYRKIQETSKETSGRYAIRLQNPSLSIAETTLVHARISSIEKQNSRQTEKKDATKAPAVLTFGVCRKKTAQSAGWCMDDMTKAS
jgi:hypothetical protein